MEKILVKQSVDCQEVEFLGFEVPDSGWWEKYFDPNLKWYVEASYQNKSGKPSIHEFYGMRIDESEHSHQVEIEFIFIGEPNYDWDEYGNYVPHWGSLYKIDGEVKHFHRHDVDDSAIVLTDGRYLINCYGKYQPDLTFITKKPWIEWKDLERKELNLSKGDFQIIEGKYFTSKKGTLCLDTTVKQPSHKLVKDDWGGSFNRYRGGTLPEEGCLYSRRASSNGGGTGYDYAVYPIEWRNCVSVDDI